jgi:hypothetical protein
MCKINPHLLQALNPVQGFDKTVTALVRKASLSEERYSVAPLISESDSKVPAQQRTYCLGLKYSGGLKTRNTYGLDSPEHTATLSENR